MGLKGEKKIICIAPTGFHTLGKKQVWSQIILLKSIQTSGKSVCLGVKRFFFFHCLLVGILQVVFHTSSLSLVLLNKLTHPPASINQSDYLMPIVFEIQ